MNIQVCRDSSDAVALYLPQRLYLKPFAKLNISVQLPPHKVHGKSISNWELMEKLRKMIQPDSFAILKVSKHSSEVIRFDAELEQRDRLERVLARLEDRIIQLNDYPDPLKVKVTEAKIDFPSRHSWDSFFRDATDMDEMKPGERPDTIHICNLPISWFVHEKDRDADALPSESIFKKVFEKYGGIRQVDVPAADPFRMQMKTHMRGISTPAQDEALYFEGYIQFSEYVGFVRCMDALRGKKLLRKKDDIAEWCSLRVDFDKTKHMTDAAVKRRAIVRERLTARARAKEDEEKQENEKMSKRDAKERQKIERVEREKLDKMKEREERRKKKQLAKLMERDDVDLTGKVVEERRKLLKAQKRLQAARLIEELFKRIELRPELQSHNGQQPERYYGERSARARIVDKFKRQLEDSLETQRRELKAALEGRIVIRSALETNNPRRSSDISSVSSDDSHDRFRDRDRNRERERERENKRIKTEKLTTPEREMEFNKATGMFGINPYFGYPFGAVPTPAHPFPFAPQREYFDNVAASMYYPMRGAYYPPPPAEAYPPRARMPGYTHGAGYRAGRGGRGRGRGPRMPFFDGPDASHQYYKYFKRLSEQEHRNEHDDRRSRSRRRSYSHSRSRSRSRRRSRSRSRRSHSRRSRSRSRRSRSRSRRSRSPRSRSRSRKRSRSNRRSRSKSRSKSKNRTPKQTPQKVVETPKNRLSKSWSLPKEGEPRQWSKSPAK